MYGNQTNEEDKLPLEHKINPLADRAQAGDAMALSSLMMLQRNPPEVWEEAKSFVIQCQHLSLALVTKWNPELAAGIQRKFGVIRADFGAGTSSSLEVFLIERVVLAWISVAHYSGLTIQNGEAAPIRRDKFACQLAVAKEKHAQACKLLERVRKRLARATTKNGNESNV